MRNKNLESFFKLFKRKRKSRGAMWASLFGLGISAAVFGVTRGKRKDSALPFQNMVKTFTPKSDINFTNTAALTEFSEELLESALRNKK
jgi:hypothetical protein